MYKNERTDAIMALLKAQRRATVSELSRMLYASEATVRRDLTELQRLGLVKRTHGGVILTENSEELSILVREEVNAAEKSATAEIALPRIPEFWTVFIDNSSTCAALAERLDLAHKTVVTNGLRLAASLSARGNVTVILPGGEFRDASRLTGSMACRVLREFSFDLALCSCAAIDSRGAFESSLPVREVKAAAMEVSQKRVLLAGRAKLHSTAPYRVAPLSGYDAIFTDAGDDEIKPLIEAVGDRIYNR